MVGFGLRNIIFRFRVVQWWGLKDILTLYCIALLHLHWASNRMMEYENERAANCGTVNRNDGHCKCEKRVL